MGSGNDACFLVADVGGTNTRVALSGPDGRPVQVARFQNDRFAAFQDVLAQYQRDNSVPALVGCCVAVAGPVTSDRARLTNRDWALDAARIADQLPLVSGSQVSLINDLAALGHALPELTGAQLQQIKPAAPGGELNDQALVAGLGTGFNICLVKGGRRNSVVIEAELGHASLPDSVAAGLRAEIGDEADTFDTVEALFSGSGLARLYGNLSGGEQRSGAGILAAYGGAAEEAVNRSVDLTARLLGRFTRQLVFHYLPFGGIHFAGGAARGILGSPARALFLHSFDAPGRFADHVGRVPVRLVTDDAAALTGAARLLASPTGT